ncbi:MAG TPA: hypothetical protein VKY27_01155 [Bacteriovoracaceae bacterium]|nr:hypothetical protein [Bacteriovoracaceae bacterium]
MKLALDPEHKESKKLNEQITSLAKKLKQELAHAQNNDETYTALYSYYRKYFTLTLKKKYCEAGINSSPTRDIILDYPWKDLELDRFFCLKVWEKINK